MDTLATLVASIGDPLVLDPDYNSPNPVHADPLIEVQSITIRPYVSCKLWGQIYVLDQKDRSEFMLTNQGYYRRCLTSETLTYQLYYRSLDNPETLTKGKDYSLPLTGPTIGPISMVGPLWIVVDLQCRRPFDSDREFLFAFDKKILDTSTHLCFEKPNTSQFNGINGVVYVNYIVLPCACIAHVQITLTKEGQGEEEGEGPDHEPPPDIGSPDDVHVSGSIIACYGKTTSGNFAGDSHHPSFILHNKSEDECDTVAYGVPIKLCSRSFVCMPAYSSLLLTLNLTFSFKEFGDGRDFSINESTEFKTCDGRYQKKYFCVGKSSLEVILNFFTSDHPLFLEYIPPKSPQRTTEYMKWRNKPQKISSSSSSPIKALSKGLDFRARRTELEVIADALLPVFVGHESKEVDDLVRRKEPRQISLWGRDRIEVLSVFVGHDSKEVDDLYGIIGVKFSKNSYYIFRRDEKHPDNLSHCGKALSLEGLTTEHSDWFCLCLRLKDLSGLVDIHNYLHIYYYHYDLKRQWFNRPLCSVVFGKQGFAVVHYIIFENAVKATLKISVVAKKGSDALPVVYGALVAQYSNCDYATTFQKNYWRSVLFEEPQEKDAHHLSEDGEIPLSKNVVSVPMDSDLVIDVDLHASVRPSAGATSDDDCSGVSNEEHFKLFVEFQIGDFQCKKLTGEYYDVLFSTKWTNGS